MATKRKKIEENISEDIVTKFKSKLGEIIMTDKELKEYAMNSVLGCSASIRPSMCRLDTNMCCFNCPELVDCFKSIRKHNANLPEKSERVVVPCSPRDFEEHEMCDYAI